MTFLLSLQQSPMTEEAPGAEVEVHNEGFFISDMQCKAVDQSQQTRPPGQSERSRLLERRGLKTEFMRLNLRMGHLRIVEKCGDIL